MTEKKTALITGATSGIGKATAILLAQNNHRVIICGRRQEALESLRKSLAESTDVHALVFDVSDKNAVAECISGLPDDFGTIDILINNAGNAHGLSPIECGSLDDWDAMIDGNVKGLLYVSRAVIPGMVERNSGQIINIGSIAGKEVYQNGNVYCASKFAVDALTKSMRMDLNPYGIRVGAVNPGLVETGFSEVRFKGDRQRAANVYKGFEPLHAQDIAEVILFMVTRPPHVSLADVTVLPTAQASATIVKKS